MKLRKFNFIIFLFFISTSVFAQQKSDDLVKSGNKKDSLKNYAGAIEDFNAALSLIPKMLMHFIIAAMLITN